MSNAKVFIRSVSALTLLGITACASTPSPEKVAAEQDVYAAAIAEATQAANVADRAAADRADPLTRASFWGEEYRKNPMDLDITVSFMRALRGINSHDRAVEISATAIALHPTASDLHLEKGRALMVMGRTQEAAISFAKASDYASATDPVPLAALGVAFDRLEDHAQAQRAYLLALEIEPTRMSTLSNYGMSLALTGDLVAAENQLRQAAMQSGADTRVRQNLALILGLQGKFDEMVAVDPTAPRRSIEANRTALRQMIGAETTYKSLEDASRAVMAAAPRETETMPEVREARVESDAMQMPEPATPVTREQTDVRSAELAGTPETLSKPRLRPKLRGSTGG
jgi:Flp pilus assembly protein TadD